MAPTDWQKQSQETSEQEKLGILGWLKRNFWGLATIIVVTIVSAVVVHTFKKPGQMSVIESQAMDMSAMVPPKGAVPVGIAKVEWGQISGSVTYTGSVQAYTDEDIYPRVTGRLVAMPVYAGDKVHKGQLLIQLDPSDDSEYSAKREEAQNAEDAAMHNAGIAKSEFSQKKYELTAAQEAEKAAQKAVEEADASLSYWRPEVAREKSLLEAQVISLDEYQKEAAELKAAQAKLEQAQAKLAEATSTKMAAQAALDTMVHHIGHQYSAAKQAQAVLKNASIYEKYTRILAQDDGVVTRRVVSPGVVVNPGMLLLKVAHVKQVRVQAQVASEDAEQIRRGDKVYIKGSEKFKEEIAASVTSIFPAADPASRTFTVEALIDNVLSVKDDSSKQVGTITQYRFLPGQYVVMRIITGEKEGLTIPTNAVIWREGRSQVWKVSSPGGSGGHSGKTKELYTCTMHPEVVSDKPGKCPKCGMDLVPKEVGGEKIAQLVEIQIGVSNPDKTEVIHGLQQGDEVIFAGYANLQPGMPVVGTQWGQAGPVTLPTASEVAGNRLDSSNNWTYEEMSGALMLKVTLNPAKGGSNSIVVKVDRHGGGSVSGSKVSLKTSMPGMNMPGPELSGTTGGNGEAHLKADLMSGLWELKLAVSIPGQQPVESTLNVEVP
jgi:multidrug efflux pump subunit AcrA (membrane-fusion protein)